MQGNGRVGSVARGHAEPVPAGVQQGRATCGRWQVADAIAAWARRWRVTSRQPHQRDPMPEVGLRPHSLAITTSQVADAIAAAARHNAADDTHESQC